MGDDILRRLRNAPWTTADDCNAAASEIERLCGELFPIRKELERARAERDEARRLYLDAACSDDEIIDEMKRRGWDCFKENTND